MAEQTDEANKPFWCRCGDCWHAWIAAYYPMELQRFAQIVSNACCPKCGATGDKIFVAKQTDGKLDEEDPACG